MIRTIIKTSDNNLTLLLADDMVGKTVELIAFDVDKVKSFKSSDKNPDIKKRIALIEQGLSIYLRDISGFKFNREESNDYD